MLYSIILTTSKQCDWSVGGHKGEVVQFFILIKYSSISLKQPDFEVCNELVQ